ncbi:hypothetical protein KVR01_013368 [Diaporthe batatas]|uniref:uncharacterized protein n=1 Tax=Diaporthe batatas TaxID=748121 RepID=UPI001D059EB3|nr:uncharacterized protein KVR01_013368 [Diaporthe batatas]KAG8156763.1 hypothetical protein KVR01_013368 [Diaporthe batatas]
MEPMERVFLSCHRIAVVLLALQVAGVLAMPTSMPTSTTTPPQWSSIVETTRLFVSLRITGDATTAIIAAGAIIGLAAASFAVFGLDWRDYYDQGPLDRPIIEEYEGFQVSDKHFDV